jgi:hypothetical protein
MAASALADCICLAATDTSSSGLNDKAAFGRSSATFRCLEEAIVLQCCESDRTKQPHAQTHKTKHFNFMQ